MLLPSRSALEICSLFKSKAYRTERFNDFRDSKIGEKGTVLGKSRIHRILPSYPLSLLDSGGERKGKKGVAVVESRQVLHE